MRILLICFYILTAHFCISQNKLKKKYRGMYEGEIPAYQILNGDSPLQIGKSFISVEFKKTKMLMTVGKLSYEGDLSCAPTENEVIILVSIEGLSVPEKFSLNKKTKKIIRFGRSPQPNADLIKVKKSRK